MDSSSVSDADCTNETDCTENCNDFECCDDDLPIVRVMGVRPYRYEPLAQEKQLREADQNRKKPESDSHVVVDIDRKGNTDW